MSQYEKSVEKYGEDTALVIMEMMYEHYETLGLIDGLTKDVELLSFVSGGCGKMEQMNLPVGFGGPFVRVSSMNVQ